jgi:hypothetical protein
MNKIPISIGILTWNSGQTLVDTLTTYYENGLFEMVSDITILFQDFNEVDYQIANHFKLNFIASQSNIGIGMGLMKLAKNAEQKNILLLEHDWKLIENENVTYERLNTGVELLNNGFDCIRYRHRTQPGYPHFSMKHIGNELEYYDDYYKMKSPHLLDSLHWLNPDERFPDKIQKNGEYFTTTSRWGNWTNNPCMYNRDFYINTVGQFVDETNQITSEGEVAVWWANQEFKVAHGEGLFKHIDLVKYGK